MVEISRTNYFKRKFKKLPEDIKLSFFVKYKLFKDNHFNPILKTHKLKGSLEGLYSFYLKQGNRVWFKFEDKNEILLVSIGKHDDYEILARMI